MVLIEILIVSPFTFTRRSGIFFCLPTRRTNFRRGALFNPDWIVTQSWMTRATQFGSEQRKKFC